MPPGVVSYSACGSQPESSVLEQMQIYFDAEKAESLVFVCVGAVALLLSMSVLIVRERFGPFLHGLAYPLAAVAMIQIAVGANVYLRTDDQLVQLVSQYQQQPAEFTAQESARMRIVNSNFEIYRRIEIGLLLLGVACAAFGAARSYWTLAGVGTGLVLQSSLMLALDFFAEARADVYTAALLAL